MKKEVKGQMQYSSLVFVLVAALVVGLVPGMAMAKAPLDPLTIPKYVTPLVIPPVMNDTGTADDYDISVREFKQQILPGGIWLTLPGAPVPARTFSATTVWSYGPAADVTPAVAPDPSSQFNYPAYTMETVSNAPVSVKWRNDLVAIDPVSGYPYPEGDPNRTFLPHILPVDQTLHWANPERAPCARRTALREPTV